MGEEFFWDGEREREAYEDLGQKERRIEFLEEKERLI